MATKRADNPHDYDDVSWEEIAKRVPAMRLESPGDIAIGRFVRIDIVEMDDDNNPGETRSTRLYVLDTADGEMGVWGSGLLDYKWDDAGEVPAGTPVKIVYKGKQELDGGRTARQYDLFLASDRPF